jgi:hypothetical protein
MTIREYIEVSSMTEAPQFSSMRQYALQRSNQLDPFEVMHGTAENAGEIAAQLSNSARRVVALKANTLDATSRYKQDFADNYVATNLSELGDILLFVMESLTTSIAKRVEDFKARGIPETTDEAHKEDREFLKDATISSGSREFVAGKESGRYYDNNFNPNKFEELFPHIIIEYIKAGQLVDPLSEHSGTPSKYFQYLRKDFADLFKRNHARMSKIIPLYKGLGLSDASIMHFAKFRSLGNIHDYEFIVRRVYNTASDNPELVTAMKSSPRYELLKLQDKIRVLDGVTENITAANSIIVNMFNLITLFRKVLIAKKIHDKAAIKSAKQILSDFYLNKTEADDSIKAMEKKLLDMDVAVHPVEESLFDSAKGFFKMLQAKFSKIRKNLISLTARIRQLN